MKSAINAIIIGVIIIISALVMTHSVDRYVERNNTIVVNGLGEKDFSADLIVWDGSFSRSSKTLSEAYTALKGDEKTIREYLLSKGISEKEVLFSSINTNKDYINTTSKEGVYNQVFDGYTLTQNVKIESSDIDKVERVAREITELIDQNIGLTSLEPEYLYTKLSELKIEMIAQATADAKSRAEQIAQKAGSKIGTLKSATMGIFQITAQNSAEEYSGGGAYNTTSRQKTASITVKLQFGIE